MNSVVTRIARAHDCLCIAQAFASTFMDVIKNSTGVASAGLPTKLNSRGDVDVPMEARVTFTRRATMFCLAVFLCV